jgi:diguanylate cyclase (GGDEF)-like protein
LKFSITALFLSVYLFVIVLLGVFLSVFLTANQTDLLLDAVVAKTTEQALLMRERLVNVIGHADFNTSEELKQIIGLEQANLQAALILDDTGEPLLDFEDGRWESDFLILGTQLALAREEFFGRPFHLEVDSKALLMRLFLPVKIVNKMLVLFLEMDMPELAKGLERLHFQLAVTLSMVLLLLLVLTGVMWFKIVKPIVKISTFTQAIVDERDVGELNLRSSDEIGQLAHNVVSMERFMRALAREARDTNPLTGLVGNIVIERNINNLLVQKQSICVIYGDLDHFKAFNDYYGVKRGDDAISLTANILTEVIKSSADPIGFVGHQGGDDFICICSPENLRHICQEIVNRFDRGIIELYDAKDRERRYIETKNRKGDVERFPIASISLAVVTNQHRALENFSEVAQIASEIKKLVKAKNGSCYAVDGRAD